jgi:hypothetical protein
MVDVNISGIVTVEMKDDEGNMIDSDTETLIKVSRPEDAGAGMLNGGVSTASGKIVFEAEVSGEKIKFLMDIADVSKVVRFMEN